MNVTTNLSLRYLKQNKKRTAITIIGVILATVLLTGVISMFTSLQHSLIKYTISQTGNWDAQFLDVQYKDAGAITNSAEVKTSMISHDLGFAMLNTPQYSYKPYIFLSAYDHNKLANYPFNLVSGRLPENTEEIALVNDLSNDQNYHIGDKITLNVGQRALADGSFVPALTPITQKETLTQTKTMTFTVVGIIEQPTFISSFIPGFTAITFLDRQSLLSSDVIDISILAKTPAQIYNFAPNLANAAHIQSNYLGYNKDLLAFEGIGPNSSYYAFALTVGGILLFIIILGSVTLIYNSFAISVSERSKQFGILSSVGGTHRQMRKIVLFEGFFISLIAIPIGLLIGLGGLTWLLTLIKPLFSSMFKRGSENLNVSLYVQPIWILLSAVLGIFTVFISALIPTFKINKISAMDAIRQTRETEINPKKLKVSPVIRKLFGTEGFLAMKNFKRNRKRYRTIIFSLSLSIILFITISTATSYMTTSVRLAQGSMNYNIGVGLIGIDSNSTKFIQNISSFQGVQDYSALREFKTGAHFNTAGIANPLLNIDGFKSNSQMVYIYSLGDAKLQKILDGIGGDLNEYADTSNPAGLLINYSIFNGPGKRIESKVFNNIPDKITINGDKSDMELSIINTTNDTPIGINSILQPGLHIIVSDKVFDAIENQVLSSGELPFTQVCIMSSDVSNTISSYKPIVS